MSNFSSPFKNFNNDPLPQKTHSHRLENNKDPKAILKRVIEKELGKKVSINTWSKQIEKDLITNVIFNFKKHCPSQPLCKTTLKILFNKIKQTLANKTHSTTFSLEVFLKHHLYLSLPKKNKKKPYTISLDLADMLKKIGTDHKTAMVSKEELSLPIWSIQKHVLSDIHLREMRSPFDSWTYEDKLIIESMVNLLTQNPLISNDALIDAITSDIKQINILSALNDQKKIKALLYTLYSNICLEKGSYDLYFSKFDQHNFKVFCSHFTDLEIDSKQTIIRNEWVERLLSLFLLGIALPKNLTEQTIENTMDESLQQLKGKKVVFDTSINKNLLIFFNASLFLHCFFSSKVSYASMKKFLIQSYKLTSNLLPFNQLSFDYLDLFIYTQLEKKTPMLHTIDETTKNYITNLLIQTQVQNPCLGPEGCLSKTILTCNQRLKINSELQKNDLDRVKLKIHMWTSSRDMVMRQMHIEPHHPFTRAITKQWQQNYGHQLMNYVNNNAFIDSVLKPLLNSYPLIAPFESAVKKHLTIYYKIFWYNKNFSSQFSTIDRWLFWNYQALNEKTPSKLEALKQLCLLFFPNIPHKQCLARFKTLMQKKKC